MPHQRTTSATRRIATFFSRWRLFAGLSRGVRRAVAVPRAPAPPADLLTRLICAAELPGVEQGWVRQCARLLTAPSVRTMHLCGLVVLVAVLQRRPHLQRLVAAVQTCVPTLSMQQLELSALEVGVLLDGCHPADTGRVSAGAPRLRCHTIFNTRRRWPVHRRFSAGGRSAAIYESDRMVDGVHTQVVVKKVSTVPTKPVFAFLVEVAALMRVSVLHPHPNVVRVVAIEHTPGACLLVTERLGTDLYKPMLDQDAYDADAIMRGVLAGLVHCHAHGVAHCDVKPENVCIARDGSGVKLIDFGLANFAPMRPGRCFNTVVGSVPYMAPELLDGVRAYQPFAADVWSAAVLYVELCSRCDMFRGQRVYEVRRHQDTFFETPNGLLTHVPAARRGIVMSMLSKAPDIRPSARACLQAFTDA